MTNEARIQKRADLETARKSELAEAAVKAVGIWLEDNDQRGHILKLMDQYRMSVTPWWAPGFHMGPGMDLRNHLRQSGFGETELGVRNLDNVYLEMVEKAMRTTTGGG